MANLKQMFQIDEALSPCPHGGMKGTCGSSQCLIWEPHEIMEAEIADMLEAGMTLKEAELKAEVILARSAKQQGLPTHRVIM